MSGFLLTPMTRFYAEVLQSIKNTGNDVSGAARGQTGGAGFAGAVNEKLAQKNGTAFEAEEQAGGRNEALVQFMSREEYTAKAEYRGESFQMGFRSGCKHTERKKKEKSYWEKRAERHKLYMDLAQKAWYKHENERKYRENIDLHRRELSSAMLQQRSLERATGEKVELGVNPSVLSQAAADFTQGYVFFKIPSALMNPKPKSMK